MKAKLDENLGRTPQRLLKRRGHDAENVYDEEMSGASDPEVWRATQTEERLLVTLDTDFADVRQYPPGAHAGILLLRPRSRSREAATALLRRVLDAHPLDYARRLSRRRYGSAHPRSSPAGCVSPSAFTHILRIFFHNASFSFASVPNRRGRVV